MTFPIQFPNQRDEMFEAARATQSLTFSERLRAITQLTRACQKIARFAPNRAAQERIRDEDHVRLVRHLQELAERHGTGSATQSA